MVVSQELGTILGKPNGLATDAGTASESRVAQPIADLRMLLRQQSHAFFPELGRLTKVRMLTSLHSSHEPMQVVVSIHLHNSGEVGF